MKRLKSFWYVFRRSLIDVDYYRDVLKVDTVFSVKYFLTLALAASLITTIRIVVPAIPRIQEVVDGLFSNFSDIYPEELVITSQSGMWQINQQEPFFIPAPESLDTGEVDFPDNLLVFDHKGTIDDIERYDTFTIINESNLIAIDSQNSVKGHSLDSLPDGEFTRTKYDHALGNIKAFTKYVPPIIVGFVLLATLFYFLIYRMLYLFIVGLVLLAIGNIRGLKKNYGTYFRIGMHAITLPLSIEVLFTMLGVDAQYPSWFFGINIVFGIAIIYHLSHTEAKK